MQWIHIRKKYYEINSLITIVIINWYFYTIHFYKLYISHINCRSEIFIMQIVWQLIFSNNTAKQICNVYHYVSNTNAFALTLLISKLNIIFWSDHSLSYTITLNCFLWNYNFELLPSSIESLINLQAILYVTKKGLQYLTCLISFPVDISEYSWTFSKRTNSPAPEKGFIVGSCICLPMEG